MNTKRRLQEHARKDLQNTKMSGLLGIYVRKICIGLDFGFEYIPLIGPSEEKRKKLRKKRK